MQNLVRFILDDEFSAENVLRESRKLLVQQIARVRHAEHVEVDEVDNAQQEMVAVHQVVRDARKVALRMDKKQPTEVADLDPVELLLIG